MPIIAATRERVSWAQLSQRLIGEALDRLPADATWEQKRAALKEAYPFGEREHYPYRMWCREVKRALGPSPKATGMIKFEFRLSLPLKMDPAVEPFLRVIADNPYERGPRLMLADWLEERDDIRAVLIREHLLCTNRQLRGMYQRITGITPNQTIAMQLMDLQLGQEPLIADPDCRRAIEASHNEAVIRMFSPEWETLPEPDEDGGTALPADRGQTVDGGDGVGGPPFLTAGESP